MKRLLLSPAFFGLTVFLASCGGGSGDSTPASSSKFALTVNVAGVPTGPVKVINTTSKATLFDGPLTGSKTFGDLVAGNVLSVQGGAVGGYATPTAQSVTLDSDKSVTVEYRVPTGAAIKPDIVAGTLTPYPGGAATISAYSPSIRSVVAQSLVTPGGQFSLSLPSLPASQLGPLSDSTCTAQPQVEPPSSRFALTDFYPVEVAGRFIGGAEEIVSAGQSGGAEFSDLLRFYASTTSRVSGQFTCDTSISTFNLDFRAGWNVVQRTFAGVDGSGTTRHSFQMYTGPAVVPSFTPSRRPLGVQLDPIYIKVQRGESASFNAAIQTPGDGSTAVKVELVEPPVGFILDTKSVTVGTASPAASRENLSWQGQAQSGLLSALTGRDSVQAGKPLVKMGFQTVPIAFHTTAEARRNSAYGGAYVLRLRFSTGDESVEASVQVEVRAPGVRTEFRDGYYSAQGAIIGAGDGVTLDAIITPEEGLTGPVRLSLSDAATGISGTGGPINVVQEAVSTPFKISVPGNVKAGTYPLPVTATHAGGMDEVGRLNIVVVAPSVQLSAPRATLYGGETILLPVTVQSEKGFQGTVTLGATDLPEGVSAAPVTLTVPRGGAAAASLPLTASANLSSVGAVQITLMASGGQLSVRTKTDLDLRPKRAALGQGEIATTTPAQGGGFWFTSRPFGDSGSAYKLALFDGVRVTSEITLPRTDGPGTWRLTTAPNGDVWGQGFLSDLAFRYASGQLQTFEMGDRQVQSIVVDDQSRLWFPAYDGSAGYQLMRLDPVTGKVEVGARVGLGLEFTYFPVVRNLDGTALFTYDQVSQRIVRVDSRSGAVKFFATPGLASINFLALDSAGTLWASGIVSNGTSRVARLNADGSLSLFPFSVDFGQRPDIFRFDQQGVLWMAYNGSGKAGSFNPRTEQPARQYDLGWSSAPQQFVLNASGGVWIVQGNADAGKSFASLLP